MSQPQVVEWYQRFCDGSRSLGDEKGPGFNGSAFSGRNVKFNLLTTGNGREGLHHDW